MAVRPPPRTRRGPIKGRRPTGDTISVPHRARAQPGASPQGRYAVRLAPGPFRIRTFQQNLGYIQIYPDISVGIFSPSNVRAKLKTLLESSAHAQVLRGKTDKHEMLLRAGGRCLQNGALSESLFRSPCLAPGAHRSRGTAPMAARPSVRTWRVQTTGRRPNGDPPTAAPPSLADSGAPPHWRYARRHDGRHNAEGVLPHWLYALRGAPVARRPRGVAPLAIRPPLRQRAPRRREGAARLAIRLSSRRA